MIIRGIFLVLVGCLTGGASPSPTAQPSSADAMVFPPYLLKVSIEGSKSLTLNTHTTLVITVEPQASGLPELSELAFDARMPEHKHGMVTKAKVTKVGANRFRVEGVRLHMEGRWVFDFLLKYGTGSTAIQSSYLLNG